MRATRSCHPNAHGNSTATGTMHATHFQAAAAASPYQLAAVALQSHSTCSTFGWHAGGTGGDAASRSIFRAWAYEGRTGCMSSPVCRGHLFLAHNGFSSVQAPYASQTCTRDLLPGGGAPGGGRIMGGAANEGRGIIMPGAGPPTPRAGPDKPAGAWPGAATGMPLPTARATPGPPCMAGPPVLVVHGTHTGRALHQPHGFFCASLVSKLRSVHSPGPDVSGPSSCRPTAADPRWSGR